MLSGPDNVSDEMTQGSVQYIIISKFGLAT